MPDDRELNALIAGGESDRVEFTASVRDLDQNREAIRLGGGSPLVRVTVAARA